MSRQVPPAFWAVCGLLLVLTLSTCFVFGGAKGLEGAALGAGGSVFNLGAWGAVIRLMAAYLHAPQPERRGTLIVVTAFLIKLPLFAAMAILANRLGGPALPCFLAGVALVYFALVGWALAGR